MSRKRARKAALPDKPPPPPMGPEGSGLSRELLGAVSIGVRDALRPAHRFLEILGGHVILCMRALSWLVRPPFRPRNYIEAIEYIGFGSLAIVILVGAFTGMVMSLQSVFAFRLFGLEEFAGGTTGKALAMELAPVLTALMLAGRAGAGIATEIGTMRISEQIDALESMAVHPVQFLILPRLVAGFLVAPILSLTFFVVGMAGAYLVAVINLGVDHGQFIANIKELLVITDVIQGILKSAVFGFLVVLVGCYQGFHATGGGRGVGIGTTRAVVIGSVSVLICDYFLTEVLLAVLPQERV
jgi:phospholipid/cholesterol/gamma-HCH transport system permease protein